jgi:hypothetical protein
MAADAAWRNRITRHADVPPAELVAHPLNARRHPKHQADALSGVLSQVGLVQSVIVNERTGRMLDGHLRAELAVARNEPSVPVAYVDLDEQEERLVLATFDPAREPGRDERRELGYAARRGDDRGRRARLDARGVAAGDIPSGRRVQRPVAR